MKPAYLFLLMSALGNCAYHIGQKSLNNTHANPLLMLNLIYGAAWLLTLLLMPLFGKASVADAAALAGSWKIWLVAGGTMIIELGFCAGISIGRRGAMVWRGGGGHGGADACACGRIAVWRAVFLAQSVGRGAYA